MLILRRRAGESLVIGDNIKITITDIYEGGVRLAIDAPRSIPILRSELMQAVNANRDAAATEAARPEGLIDLLGTVPEGKEQPL